MDTQSKGTQTNKSSNSTWIIIVIVLALLFLGVAGFLSWKYYFKDKFSSKNSSTSESNSSFTLSKLEDMLKYPKGTLTSIDHSANAGYTSVLSMQTDDSVNVVNDYYLALNSNQKWTVTAKALEPDNSRADITLEGTKEKFTVTLIIDHNDVKTEILARIDAEDLPKGDLSEKNNTTTNASNSGNSTATQTSISGDYVINDSNTRLITESELTNFSPWQLKVARNEIYARHGRPFVHKDLQCYFKTKTWYTIDSNFSESVLSSIETKNIATIKSYEEKINSSLQSSDSGCKS